ncbi:MAG TPA: hypothetical protein VJ743_02540 [Albitalea sp.]|nr:hypothetical protein [Albitalea sp.]
MSVPDPVDERDALARLARVRGPTELQATILALITPADSVPSFVAWTAETRSCANAAVLREDVTRLSDATRLPCLEIMLDRMRGFSKDERRSLLESTRRVVAAITPLRPLDRLHWLLMRRKLGEKAPVAQLPDAHNRLDTLPPMMIVRIAGVAAYVARMVPGPAEGAMWYQLAMSPVVSPERMPPCHAPDGDGLARALIEVEALPWMLRPVLLRAWVDAAFTTGQRARLRPMAADALRLVADLLESPLPPELARHYSELDWETAR